MDISTLHDLLLHMNERQQRLFGCDCVERVLHLIEERNPHEQRSRRAVEAARKYAEGLIDSVELMQARSQGSAVCSAFNGHPLRIVAVAAAATTCEQPMDLWYTCLNDWAVVRINAMHGTENSLAALMGYAAAGSRSIIGFRASRNQQLRDDAEASEYEWQLERARWYLDGEHTH